MHPNRIAILESVTSQVPVTSGQPLKKISETYGSSTFSLREMEQRLSKDVFEGVKRVIQNHAKLDTKLAGAVAEAAKSWALSHGVTHFTHWFQPMTGLTAEKHDSFISYDNNGGVIEKFSAGQLIQSEPDASSFPSGGMRSTFEARGYTAWDVSSPLFIIEHAGANILCIPSVFVSYTGHSLDTKTGLMRSVEALSHTATELLHEMGDKDVKRVSATVGCEQEYFLIDRHFVGLRPDLLLTGRTLLGADMPKGQQLEDHYFGSIPSRVQAFMVDIESELYRLGVPIKTRHNEVAPSQFELAPIFEEANLASDHNMLTMEVLKRTATKHGFTCLLHEKPFAGINGSGKHNNWSMATDTGENLLEPGNTPHANFRFLAVLSCVLDAVFKNQIALRAAIASHGNDHRLGANEAPPAIISAFLGSALTHILETLEKGGDLSKLTAEKARIEFNLNRLPSLPKDNTDRNRTSPFAFTGNKFEFRAVGSSQMISFPMAVLNSAVVESMQEFTTKLRALKATAASTESAVLEVAKEFTLRSKAIRFEGNGYSEEWRAEAKKRGLHELLKTPESLAAFAKKDAHAFLVRTGILREEEVEALVHIRLEQYTKHLDIEAKTLATLVRQYVLPAAQIYQSRLAHTVVGLKDAGVSTDKSVRATLKDLSEMVEQCANKLTLVNQLLDSAHAESDPFKVATAFGEKVAPAMIELRTAADALESLVPDELWGLPKYREMLFVR
ncbi:MAG: glutamine synthetase III [Bdellovibrionales bacterium]|nr:glutamine synthetase III [Bdellovibrionales bacterium]